MKRLIIAYDIPDDRRRQHVSHLLEGYGDRVQKSVFECELDRTREIALRLALEAMIDVEEDRLHIYPLCDKDHALSLAWDSTGKLAHRDLWVL